MIKVPTKTLNKMISSKIIATVGLDSTGFINQVKITSRSMHILPEWLLTCIYMESRFNPKAVNKDTGASGLIQIMPSTAKDIKISLNEILSMGAIAQVQKVIPVYFKNKIGRMKSVYDVYFAIFYPVAIGKPNSFIIGREKSLEFAKKVRNVNSGYDFNKDGVISVGEVKLFVDKNYFTLFPDMALKLPYKFLKVNSHFKK